MEPDRLYRTAMKRGDAKRVGTAMGYTSGEIPRRWFRKAAGPTNLATGQLSPLTKAKRELLAHDRVNPQAADTLLFDLFVADVARQRARLAADDADAILVALVEGNAQAVRAFLADPKALQTEEDLYRAGAAIVRALLFVVGDDGAGVPLLRVENEKTWYERAIAWVRSL
jgi:hypothetical protein